MDARGCLLLEREARRLGDVRLDAIEDWIEAELACGRHLHLLAELERLVDGHPLRERLCTQRVIALYRCGRPADALSGCRELATRLVEELGVRTSPHLQELEEAMLAHDPEAGRPVAAVHRRHQRARADRPATQQPAGATRPVHRSRR